MNISQAIEEERQRLDKRLEEISAQKAELDRLESEVLVEISAIRAYVDVRLGRVASRLPSASKSVSVRRIGRTGLRQRVLGLIHASPSGIKRSELMMKMEAKGDMKKEQSINSAIAALKRQQKITSDRGVYASLPVDQSGESFPSK